MISIKLLPDGEQAFINVTTLQLAGLIIILVSLLLVEWPVKPKST